MKRFVSIGALALLAAAAVHASSPRAIRVVPVDPVSRLPVEAAIEMEQGSLKTQVLYPAALSSVAFDMETLRPTSRERVLTIRIPVGESVVLQTQGQLPTKDIYIKVRATRIRPAPAVASQGTTRNSTEIKKFSTTTGSNGANALVQGQAGVASDSAGQQHVRGEHAEITYVVDGVPLPDTLSGRQGSIVVPSTVDTLDIIEGGFAPEFGGQTAAILNVTTTPGSRKQANDLAFDVGTFNTFDGELTSVGPLGSKGSYTFDLQGSRTGLYQEPQQPGHQTAHNTGTLYSIFSKVRFSPTGNDALTLTLSHNPVAYQDPNRAGLPASFADLGQGYGFLGQRNADGTIPNPTNPGGLGAQSTPLLSQQSAGMDIRSKEINEFAILNWRRQISRSSSAQLAVTSLHSGGEVQNNNPHTDVLNLPVDNSIEYSPDVTRNIHHLQASGSIVSRHRSHEVKAGFLIDRQTGNESYSIRPESQLALDQLAATDSRLAPAGSVQTDANGKPVLDVNGNPIYRATSNAIPTLQVSRSGWYDAIYLQDTWTPSKRFTANYGLRYDYFSQSENIGQSISKGLISPRVNLQYKLNSSSVVRGSYNKLFNTPPLAQGAIAGEPIQPETLDQYDVSLEHNLGHGQSLKAAYYYKQIKNQVDTGLLIPGSQIGLYSAVNLERGGVHGLELSYNLYAPKGIGWDGYFNYSLAAAKPNGKDNTGADVPDYNDHDQRHTVGAGVAYTWKNQASAALTVQYGSGLASSILRNNRRTPREQTDLRYTSSPKLFQGHGGFGVSIENLFDERSVINFQSGFSGTRFMKGRSITFSIFAHW